MRTAAQKRSACLAARAEVISPVLSISITASWVSHTINAISSASRPQAVRFLSPDQKGRATAMNCFQAARERVGGRLREDFLDPGGKDSGAGVGGAAAAEVDMERKGRGRKAPPEG